MIVILFPSFLYENIWHAIYFTSVQLKRNILCSNLIFKMLTVFIFRAGQDQPSLAVSNVKFTGLKPKSERIMKCSNLWNIYGTIKYLNKSLSISKMLFIREVHGTNFQWLAILFLYPQISLHQLIICGLGKLSFANLFMNYGW